VFQPLNRKPVPFQPSEIRQCGCPSAHSLLTAPLCLAFQAAQANLGPDCLAFSSRFVFLLDLPPRPKHIQTRSSNPKTIRTRSPNPNQIFVALGPQRQSKPQTQSNHLCACCAALQAQQMEPPPLYGMQCRICEVSMGEPKHVRATANSIGQWWLTKCPLRPGSHQAWWCKMTGQQDADASWVGGTLQSSNITAPHPPYRLDMFKDYV